MQLFLSLSGIGKFFSDYVRYFPQIIKGAPVALSLTFFGILFGLIIGLFITSLKRSGIKPLGWFADFYTWFLRGTPMMVQLYFLYYGLPQLGINLNAYLASVLGLSLNIGAYMAEIIRGGLASVDKGQFEAAKALGFSKAQTMRHIIYPQTLRVIMPTLGNEIITLLKDTSLVAAISLTEILKLTQQITSRDFNPLPAYAVAATFYLFFTSLLTLIFRRMENKLAIA